MRKKMRPNSHAKNQRQKDWQAGRQARSKTEATDEVHDAMNG
jgi:hypothetical protein